MRTSVLIVCAGLLTACAAAPKPKLVDAPPPAPPALDASYDWHVLLAAPLGTVLREVPLTLHEVLLFNEENRAAGAGEDGDCYSSDGAAPRFLTRVPETYTLCFRRDRLARIEATVRLPADRSAQMFADACALWKKNAGVQPPPPVAAAQPATAVRSPIASAPPIAVAPAGDSVPADACSGTDAGTTFAGRLDEDPDQADVPLTIRLDVPDRP